MAVDSQEKRMSVSSGLPWMAMPLPTGTVDVEERASIAALYTYAFAEAAVVEPTRSKRGIVPHISPPISPFAEIPVAPAPHRGGLAPFRSNVKDIKEARQALQHLSARVSEAEGNAVWNVVGPITEDYLAEYGDFVLIQGPGLGGLSPEVSLPKVTGNDMGKRVAVKLFAESFAAVVRATGGDLIDAGVTENRNPETYIMGGKGAVTRNYEGIVFIADGARQWHIMGGYWHGDI